MSVGSESSVRRPKPYISEAVQFPSVGKARIRRLISCLCPLLTGQPNKNKNKFIKSKKKTKDMGSTTQYAFM